ncbi:hypothetical protein LTS18_006244 [Coniosporium uncinatum]|uniref:Uncharacterized protein n=1 Tax=Coniosporium uncinatum TaxID=93489 RepID=A0ACC3DQB8_9PEZI|nr:hypothetical protein LTS18_006244 [Coniosporium uncinatum]
MSSRALRKAQRQLEEQQQLEKAQKDPKEEREEEEEEDEPVQAPTKAKSVFAMLNDEEENEDVDEEVDTSEEVETELIPQPAKSSNASKKKRTKKAKGKAADAAQHEKPKVSAADLDEIDVALKQLSMMPQKNQEPDKPLAQLPPEVVEICHLLAVDTQHLHAANEMRRLFGRAALEAEHEQPDGGQGRRRRGQQQMGLAGAVAGRNAPGGRLATLGLRRNIFIQGKEEWPKATSGGLGMEVVSKHADGTIEYRFMHTKAYQDVQKDFEVCVASMDPQRMIHLLQMNPYHVSTLLQVSEIAKQERDHATSGDLLERALFTFGRAVHSTFAKNLSEGKARLDFRRPENREFWLAAWRYIANLGMRSTWRTVYEWAKLLLGLDPEGDPYEVRLVLDQYALRAHQPQNFLDLANSTLFKRSWKDLPNVQYTAGLACIQTKQPTEGRNVLKAAIEEWPWIAARLFQELEINPVPPSVWGKSAAEQVAKLHTELYVTRAKDLWNTPEATAVLNEVTYAAKSSGTRAEIDISTITVNEARHTILTDKPELIALLPRNLTGRLTSSSDPLPPDDNVSSYDTSAGIASHARRQLPAGAQGDQLQQIPLIQSLLDRVFPGLLNRARQTAEGRERGEEPPDMDEDELQQRLVETGMDRETFRDLQRQVEDMVALQRGAELEIAGGEGDEDGSESEGEMPELRDPEEDGDEQSRH